MLPTMVCGGTRQRASIPTHPNEAWWASQVCCSKAEVVTKESERTGMEKFYKFDGVDGNELLVKNTVHPLKGPPYHLLGADARRSITAFTEVRQPFWRHQPDCWLTYHAFLVLEVDHGALHLICERKTDLLELVIGATDIPRGCMKAFRAFGPGRNLGRCSEQPKQKLGHLVSLYDLLDWIDGPTEESWQPYNMFRSNCQHFTRDLQKFLEDPSLHSPRITPLQAAPVEQQQDRRYVLTEVAKSWRALKHAREEFRMDKGIVLAALAQDGQALRYAHERLRMDREVVLEALRRDGAALYYVEGDLKYDWEVVHAAVSQQGRMLCYVADEFRRDREVVLAAVRQDGYSIRHALGGLRWDPEVVLAAGLQNPISLARSLL